MLRTRLLLGFTLLLVLLCGAGAYAVRSTQQLGRSVADTVVTNARGLIVAQQLKDEANRLGIALRRMRAGDSPGNRADLEEASRAAQALLRPQQAQAASDPMRQARLEAIEAAFQRLAGRAGVPAGATDRPLDQMKADEAAFYAAVSAIDQLTEHDARFLNEAEANARVLTARTTAVFAIGVGAVVLLAIFCGWALDGILLRPIRQLTASAAALGEGRLDRDVPVTSRDELGELARTFNTMAARLRAYRDAMTEKAQRAQRTMEATLTSAPDPLFVVARDGTHEVRNPAAEALAVMPEFATGLPPEIARPLAEVLATGNHYLPTDYQRVVTLRDRHYLPRILAIGDTLTDFRGAAIVLQDVTKFRLLDDAKGNLVGTVSHELKTPLTSLRLAVYLLLEPQAGELSPTQRELLETTRDDADRLLRILNDLLDLSRLESGVVAANLEPADVPALLEEMAREVRSLVTAAGQSIAVRTGGALGSVPVDRDRIRHVFINLLTNASKYSEPGDAIELYAEPADEGFVRFGVRDRGPGIAPENAARVFEKFYRVPGQTKKGAGLGLAICREIVVAHGGSIACVSRPGGGSDFYFLLSSASNQPPQPLKI